MATAKLFTPLRVGRLELGNRIVIAPMCHYSVEDGCMTEHFGDRVSAPNQYLRCQPRHLLHLFDVRGDD
jgi:hypothetical protein